MLNHGLDILTWWEIVVKPGILKIALERSRQVRTEKQGDLNILFIKQAYLVRKLRLERRVEILTALKTTQSLICKFYEEQSKQIQIQTRKDEFAPSEVTRIYHHDLHRKYLKKSSIVKLDTEEGMLGSILFMISLMFLIIIHLH